MFDQGDLRRAIEAARQVSVDMVELAADEDPDFPLAGVRKLKELPFEEFYALVLKQAQENAAEAKR